MGAEKVLEEWQMFLNNHDLGGITGLYSDEAVLWGTFSDIIRDSPGLIEEYFRRLLEKDQLNVEIVSVHPRDCSGVHLYSGTYEFSYQDTKPVILPARFTFVIGPDKDTALRILEHHSSLIPETSGR